MRRPPEDFLIHPTSPTAMIMEDYIASPHHFRSSTWSNNAVPVTPPSEVFQLKPGKKTPEAGATIQDLIDEPIFWRGYTSDEEIASPVDDNRSFDSSSFCYDSDDVVSIHDAVVSPQQSTQSLGKGKQQVTQAQAVQFTSAGKAKVVSMSTPRVCRTAPSSPTKPPVSKMNRMNIEGRTINFSRTITSQASIDFDDSADADQSVPRPKRVVRRKPDVSALQAISRSQSPSYSNPPHISSMAARRAGVIEPDDPGMVDEPLSEGIWFSQSSTPEEERPSSQFKQASKQRRDSEPASYPAQEASLVPDSPPYAMPRKRSLNYILQASSARRLQDTYTFSESPSLSRPRLLHKLSTTFSFKTFSRRPSRQDSLSSASSSEMLQAATARVVKPAHVIAEMHIPTRTSSKPLPKMVPRGANERASPIVIPPCPEDWSADEEEASESPARWSIKKGSLPVHEKHEPVASAIDVVEAAEATSPKTHTHQRKKSHSTSSGSGSS